MIWKSNGAKNNQVINLKKSNGSTLKYKNIISLLCALFCHDLTTTVNSVAYERKILHCFFQRLVKLRLSVIAPCNKKTLHVPGIGQHWHAKRCHQPSLFSDRGLFTFFHFLFSVYERFLSKHDSIFCLSCTIWVGIQLILWAQGWYQNKMVTMTAISLTVLLTEWFQKQLNSFLHHSN